MGALGKGLACGLLLAACSRLPPAESPEPAGTPRTERRTVMPTVAGRPVTRGIGYGPFREGQAPGGPFPTEAELLEDLRILAARWSMIRLYASAPPTESILRSIREEGIPLTVMLGIWIAPESRRGGEADEVAASTDGRARNDEETSRGIRLARAYPDVVFAVAVGNETQVFWSNHRVEPSVLVSRIRTVRDAIDQPVTTADDYNFWNREESRRVADELDFIVLHAYAMWNRQRLEDAVPWTADVYEGIAANHPSHRIFLGETGWASVKNPDATGDEQTQIIAEASEEAQRTFYRDFIDWVDRARIPHFYFEAFDEPWKGGPDPRGVEKHWGLYRVARTPKAALAGP